MFALNNKEKILEGKPGARSLFGGPKPPSILTSEGKTVLGSERQT